MMPKGGVTKYAYDASNLLSLTAPKGNVTRYDYDSRDRLIKRTDALGKVETHAYDANSNLIKSTDRKGQVTTYQYDANDRLVSTTYADGKVVTSTYDDEDRLISLNDTAPGAGQHNFTYDILDRLTQETNPRGTVSYSYDVLGRRTSLKVNNQRTLNYSYDDNDRLTAITEGSETFGFNYDALDRRVGMTLPNGVSSAYNYDAAGRLTGMKYSKGTQVLRDLTYGYDEINRRTSYSGNTAPEPQETATNTATINALNQYTTLNGKPVAHDNNGNQIINNAVWDARDRLVSLSGPNFTASFTYDAMGRRSSKTVNGQTKTYLYDGSDLISETGAEYTFGSGIDQPLKRKSGQNEYYLSDALGSVIGLTDPNGAIKTSYNYSPFGKKQTTGTASGNPFAFTGREDDGNGYYFYRARYYSPEQKRFISEDPLGFGGGDTNLQAYVGNSPTNFTDPTGQIVPAIVVVSVISGAIGGAVSTAYFEGVLGGTRGNDLLAKIAIGTATGAATGYTVPLAASSTLALAAIPIIGGLGNMAGQSIGRTCTDNLPQQLFMEAVIGGGANLLTAGMGVQIGNGLAKASISEAARAAAGQLAGVGLGVPSGVVGNLGTRAGEALGCGCKKH
jgi:RHS repeat-associated protein